MSAIWYLLLVTAFSILPVPAEVVMFRNLHAYGTFIGTLMNWSGALLGAEILFLMTRFIRVSLSRVSKSAYSYRLIAKPRTKRQRIWILILVRILPVPAKVVDISAGMIRTINGWEFTWTTGIGMIPYQLFMVLIFRGWQTRSVYIWLVVVIVTISCLVIFLRMKKREG